MKTQRITKYVFILLAACMASCEIDDQVNPNSAALEDVLNGASTTDLNNLVTGSLANMRQGYDVYVTATGTVARELYLFDADPRNRTDLLGVNVETLDGNSFYTTAPWNERYQTIKNLNILIEALENAQPEVTEAEKAGYRGFANTIKAHQYILLINAQGENGIRLDVADPDNLGPIVTDVDQVYTFILGLLDEAASQLQGAEFAMNLFAGFDGFNTPETFLEFNRALAARVNLYAGNNQAALDALDASYFDLSAPLDLGPEMIYSTAGPDILNNLFKAPNQNGDQIVVNDGFVEDAEEGDQRVVEKTALREDPAGQSGVNGLYETRLYESPTAPIEIIRNEELILIYAEAKLNLGMLDEAVEALDVIRTNAGLEPLALAKPDILNDPEALRNELLRQRRYSLWGEGHFMVDLRRNGELSADSEFVDVDPIIGEDGEVVPQIVFQNFPVPTTEN